MKGGGDGELLSPCSDPPVPPWAVADVCQLLSMFMAGLSLGTPRINTFSADATPGKTEVSFEQCSTMRYSVSRTTTLRQWSRRALSSCINGASLADMARYMGPTASIAHVLQKNCHVIFSVHSGFF